MRFYLFFVLFARRDVHPKKSTRFSPPRPSRGSLRPLERVFPLSVRRPGRDRGGGGGSQRPLERVFPLSVRRPRRDRGGGGGSQRPLERVSQPPLHMSGSGWRGGGGQPLAAVWMLFFIVTAAMTSIFSTHTHGGGSSSGPPRWRSGTRRCEHIEVGASSIPWVGANAV